MGTKRHPFFFLSGIKKATKTVSVPRTERRIPVVAFLIFLTTFTLTRLPYFLFYRIVTLDPDSAGYVQIVDQINKGFAPHLSIRTPGYPLFLKTVFAFFSSNLSVAAVQHALSLLTGLLFIGVIASVFRERPRWAILSALAFSAFISIGWHVQSDSSLMSDSLAISMMVLFLSLLILGLRRHKSLDLILASSALAASILVRPSAMSLVIAVVLAIVFMVRNGYGPRLQLSLTLPLAAILMALMGYNALTIHSFTVTSFTEHAMISFTSTFLEPDPNYGPAANEAIEQCRRALGPKERQILEVSWNPVELSWIFRKYYEQNRMRIVNAMLAHEPPEEFDLYQKWRPLWRRMAMDAVRQYPRTMLKYAFANLVLIFYDNTWHQTDVYGGWQRNFVATPLLIKDFSSFGITESSFNRRFNTRSYAETLTPLSFAHFLMRENIRFAGKAGPPKSRWRRLFEGGHRRWLKIHGFLFRNPLWTLAFLAAFVFSMIRTIRTGFRHYGAFVLLLLTGSAAAYGVFLAFSSLPYLRYTYALEFVYYLSPFLWPIALDPRK